jgi:MFS family permease
MRTSAEHLRRTIRIVREVLGNPVLRRVELAFLGFNAVESGAWIAILLYAYDATGPASVGLVAVAQLIPAGLCAPLASTLGDRRRRDHVLVGGYLSLGLALGLTALAMLRDASPLVVYALAIVASVSLTVVRPAQGALLPSLARTPAELAAANAVSGIAEAGGLLAGPLLAAAILSVASTGTVLACLSALVLASALLVGLSTTGGQPAAPRRGGHRQAGLMLEGFRALARDRDARLLVAVLSSRMLMIGVTDVLFVLLALELFMSGEEGAALLTAALGAGGVVGGGAAFLLVGHRKIATVLFACAAACGAAFAALSLPGAALVAPVLMVIAGVGLTVMDIAGRTILQRAVDDAVLARVFGILEGLSMWSLAAGSLLVTIVVAVAGLQGAVIAFAAMLPLLLALAWPSLMQLDRRAAVPVRELELLSTVRYFDALDPPSLEALAQRARWQAAAAGSVIIREGERGEDFYILESGSVSASREGRFLRRLSRPGDTFGEIALLRDIPRTASVTADEPTVMLALDRPGFLAAVTGNPAAAAALGRVADARFEDRDP